MSPAAARSAKEAAMRLLERRDYGRDELAAKLVEKGFEAPEAAAAADRCVELGFINDENYAAMVARHYTARGFGERRVLEELRRALAAVQRRGFGYQEVREAAERYRREYLSQEEA